MPVNLSWAQKVNALLKTGVGVGIKAAVVAKHPSNIAAIHKGMLGAGINSEMKARVLVNNTYPGFATDVMRLHTRGDISDADYDADFAPVTGRIDRVVFLAFREQLIAQVHLIRQRNDSQLKRVELWHGPGDTLAIWPATPEADAFAVDALYNKEVQPESPL